MYNQARWHPYNHERRRPSVPDQSTLMADIELMERKRKADQETGKKLEEYENVMSERKAADLAANAYDSPFVGRAMEYTDHRYEDFGCIRCSAKDRRIEDLTSENAKMGGINGELRWQIRQLQDGVTMQERNTQYDRYHGYL